MKRMLFIAGILFTLAIIRGFYRLPQSSFDADEEYFALSAQSILSGKLTLIGQQTGIGKLYHAPLFNYLIAILMAISKGNPLVIKGLGAFLTAITVPTIFLIGRKITSFRAALLSALLALISPSFLGLDSVASNVVPLSLITLFYLYVLQLKINPVLRSLILGLLVGLSFHFHILGTMLILPLLFINLFWIPSFILLVSPLIFFDLRHHFLILRHALNFFSLSSTAPTPIFYRLDTYLISLSDLISTSILARPLILLTTAIIFFSILNPKIKKSLKIVLILPLIFFLVYSGHLAPYYAVIAWIPLILIAGHFAGQLWQKRFFGKVLVAFFIFYIAFNNTSTWYHKSYSRGINNKIAVLKFIKEKAGSQPFHISRTMDPAANFGFDYLISWMKLNPTDSPDDPTYTIVAPFDFENIKSDMYFGDFGLVLPR